MKLKRLVGAMLTAALALSALCVPTAASDAWTAPLSINETLPKENLLMFSTFNADASLEYWDKRGQQLELIKDDNGGYLKASGISVNYHGYHLSSPNKIPAGTYRFTGYLRSANEGEVTSVRVQFVQKDGTKHIAYTYLNNDWLYVEYYFTLTDTLSHILVNGGGQQEFIQDYCMDNFCVVPVDSIPAGTSNKFGTQVTGEQAMASMMSKIEYSAWDPNESYEVQGIIINTDDSGFLRSIGNTSCTEDDIINFAKQHAGSHITDYMMCINSAVAAYPSEVWTDYLDKYYTKEENGQAVDYTTDSLTKGAHHVYETLATDYIGLLHEAFREVGISPWLSVRMNDVHNQTAGKPNATLSEFWYNNPQYRRVSHHSYVEYMDYAMDYTHKEVRDYVLSLINEALNRYDTDGIELDFQRELRLWHIGGEYNGVEIMNEFMRELDELIKVYEVKYGHEIKTAVRVAPDIMSCYNFGLDVVTWAAEGNVDLVIPSGRYESTDNDIPVKLWDSLLTPFDVELAPCIDPTNLRTYAGATSGKSDIETISGAAANMLSQGADKIYLYNFFLTVDDVITEEDKITSKDPYFSISTVEGYWNVITTVGSYDKLMTMNRRNIITYRDMWQYWETRPQSVPITVGSTKYAALRIPVGDVPEGAELYVKFSANKDSALTNPPSVYVNSQLCTYVGSEVCLGNFTENKLLCYTVPEACHDDTYMVIEIKASSDSFSCDYAEVYVKAAD